MLIDAGQEILRRITLLNRLEKGCIVAALIFFLITVCIFLKMKIYQCIYILSGKKVKKNIKNLHKNKNKETTLYLMLLVGVILCNFFSLEGNAEKNLRKKQSQTLWIKTSNETLNESENTFPEKVKNKEEETTENELSEDSAGKEEMPPEFDFSIESTEIAMESEKYPNSIFYRTSCQARITIKTDEFNQTSETEKLRLKVRKSAPLQTTLEKMKYDTEINGEWKETEYSLEDFTKSENVEDEYELMIPFAEEIGEEIIYDVLFAYQSANGQALIPTKGTEIERLGTLMDGAFYSKEIVIDQKAPDMDREIRLEKGKEDGSEVVKNGEYYYDGKIAGSIFVREQFFDESSVQILAIPLHENASSQEMISIKKWNCEQWEGDTVNYRITFDFQEEGRWMIAFSCKDIAENEGLADGKEAMKSSSSPVFIIDRIAPEIIVEYSKDTFISDKLSSPENVNKEIRRDLKEIISSECEVFIEKGATQKVEIIEENFNAQEVKLNICKIDYSNKNATKVITDDICGKPLAWKEEGGEKHALTVSFQEEGHYQIILEYEDPVGHSLVANQDKETMVCLEKGSYKSPMWTLDSKLPVIEKFIYETEESARSGDRIYFRKKPEICISVVEENFNKNDFYLEDILFYANGKKIKPPLSEKEYAMEWESFYEKGERVNRAKIIIEEEANHTFYVNGFDGGFHEAQMIKEEFTYDKTEPKITYMANQDKKGDIQFQKVNYIGYETFRYFSKNKIPVTVIAHDEISGVGEISYYFLDTQGNKINNLIEKGENRGKNVENLALDTYQVEAVVDVEEFKGVFCVKAEDYSGNQCEEISCRGMVSESKAFHEKTSESQLELSDADYTDSKTKTKYYKSNAEIYATISDGQSGIHHIKMIANPRQNQNFTKEKSVIWKNIDYFENPNITYSTKEKINLPAEKFIGICKENPIEIRVELTDNAGNVSYQDYSDYKIVTDNIKPVISVRYEDSMESHLSQKKYYNKTRVATITVEDWNFNPDSVKWKIEGSNKEYRITPWKGNGQYHWCKVIFQQDGEGYKIKLTASDFAGNKTNWDGDRAFVIDKTKPVLSLQIDADNGRDSQKIKNKRYYNSPQTVLLKIIEKNFREQDVIYKIEARKDGKRIDLPVLNHFRRMHAEQEYGNTILFREDGDYKVSLEYTDLAGNKGTSAEVIQFTIDQTKPEIKISGVKKNDAYPGKVEPVVTCTDRNLDEKSFACVIENSEGKKIREKDFPRNKEQIKNGFQIKWKDFPYEEWIDDIYTLKVIGKDLAGNSSTIENGLTFSVNRFGSVFILQPQSEEWIKKKYINDEQDLCIREISVNQIDTEIIILKDNQERRQLKAIDEKTILEKELINKKGSYTVSSNVLQKNLVKAESGAFYFSNKNKSAKETKGWREKTYTINKENFEEEGVYQITLHSVAYQMKDGKKERIKETDNITKNVPIQFTVDKKAPVVKISGLDQNAYIENEHFFNVTVLDNYGLDYLDLNINYENGKKGKETIRILPEKLGIMHGISEKLEAYNGYQVISYTARDLAGNELCSSDIGDDKRCIISPNQLIQTYYGHPMLCWIVVGMILLLTLTIFCFFYAIYKRG